MSTSTVETLFNIQADLRFGGGWASSGGNNGVTGSERHHGGITAATAICALTATSRPSRTSWAWARAQRTAPASSSTPTATPAASPARFCARRTLAAPLARTRPSSGGRGQVRGEALFGVARGGEHLARAAPVRHAAREPCEGSTLAHPPKGGALWKPASLVGQRRGK